MDFGLAHILATDMTQRLTHAEDFFSTLHEFDNQRKFKEEYSYGLKAAMSHRIPLEDEAWKIKAQNFLKDNRVS